MSFFSRITRRSGRALAAGVVGAACLAAPAHAATCEGSLSTPFVPWGDAGHYTLAPGGSLESTSGWTLTGGAKLVKGSEPFKATGASGSFSLAMPSGATAVSPPVCLSFDRPTFRFFAKASQGNSASMRAETLASNPNQVIGLGAVNGTTSWAPTAPLSTGARNLLLDPNGSILVRLRFTADYGNWQIDDVYVDPWARR